MPAARELKRRIKSVKNTKKITRAMQMISAVKMRKAQDAAINSKRYAEMADQIVQALIPRVSPRYNALLRQNPTSNRVAVVVVSTNRGLVGGFNSNLIKEVQKYTNGLEPEILADFIVSGKKAREALVRMHQNLIADYPKLERLVKAEEIDPIAQSIVDEFLKGTYKQVVVVYMQFISTLVQKPRVIQLLPFVTTQQASEEDFDEEEAEQSAGYILEPDPTTVLNALLPRIIESQLYRSVLENDASEHSARMVMMKNATEAASDLIDDLTLTYNQLRQAGITKELAEISAGRAAIE
jgi:F-type H+-transporting ATPase subunit gamma